MSARIEIKGVARKFGSNEVLRGVDLSVSAGELLGIVGPNGGGKSTLLLLMAGLLRPTSGSIKVCGIAAERLALESAGKVGLVLAKPGLYPLLTGWENLVYFGGLYGLSDEDVRNGAAESLQRFDLTDHMDKRTSGWSTGMQQKLSLVRALLLKPEVLLFDEPAANLDPVAADMMYQELKSRAEAGLACVLVTHDLHAAQRYCDRVVFVQVQIHREVKPQTQATPEDAQLLSVWREVVA